MSSQLDHASGWSWGAEAGARTSRRQSFSAREQQDQASGAADFSAAAVLAPLESLRNKFNQNQIAEIDDLAGERDPEIFFTGLLAFGQRLQNQGKPEIAAEVYSIIVGAGQMNLFTSPSARRSAPGPGVANLNEPSQSHDLLAGGRTDVSLGMSVKSSGPPRQVAPRSQQKLNAIMGVGSVGYRAEVLLQGFAKSATDFRTIAPMVAGSAIYQLTKTAALGRLALSTRVNWFTRGWGANLSSALIGTAAEVPVFGLGTRWLHQLGGEAPVRGVGADLLSAGLTLGVLKITGFAGHQAVHRINGLRAGGAIHELPLQLSQAVIPQASMFVGLMGSHKLEAAVGLRPHVDGATAVTDTLASMVSLGVGSRLGHSLLGPRFAKFQGELAARARQSGEQRSLPQFSVQAMAIAGAGAMLPANAPRARIPNIMLSEKLGEDETDPAADVFAARPEALEPISQPPQWTQRVQLDEATLKELESFPGTIQATWQNEGPNPVFFGLNHLKWWVGMFKRDAAKMKADAILTGGRILFARWQEKPSSQLIVSQVLREIADKADLKIEWVPPGPEAWWRPLWQKLVGAGLVSAPSTDAVDKTLAAIFHQLHRESPELAEQWLQEIATRDFDRSEKIREITLPDPIPENLPNGGELAELAGKGELARVNELLSQAYARAMNHPDAEAFLQLFSLKVESEKLSSSDKSPPVSRRPAAAPITPGYGGIQVIRQAVFLREAAQKYLGELNSDSTGARLGWDTQAAAYALLGFVLAKGGDTKQAEQLFDKAKNLVDEEANSRPIAYAAGYGEAYHEIGQLRAGEWPEFFNMERAAERKEVLTLARESNLSEALLLLDALPSTYDKAIALAQLSRIEPTAPLPLPAKPPEPLLSFEPGKTLKIGRHPGNDLVLSAAQVSKHHAELRAIKNSYGHLVIIAKDVGSRNGTVYKPRNPQSTSFKLSTGQELLVDHQQEIQIDHYVIKNRIPQEISFDAIEKIAVLKEAGDQWALLAIPEPKPPASEILAEAKRLTEAWKSWSAGKGSGEDNALFQAYMAFTLKTLAGQIPAQKSELNKMADELLKSARDEMLRESTSAQHNPLHLKIYHALNQAEKGGLEVEKDSSFLKLIDQLTQTKELGAVLMLASDAFGEGHMQRAAAFAILAKGLAPGLNPPRIAPIPHDLRQPLLELARETQGNTANAFQGAIKKSELPILLGYFGWCLEKLGEPGGADYVRQAKDNAHRFAKRKPVGPYESILGELLTGKLVFTDDVSQATLNMIDAKAQQGDWKGAIEFLQNYQGKNLDRLQALAYLIEKLVTRPQTVSVYSPIPTPPTPAQRFNRKIDEAIWKIMRMPQVDYNSIPPLIELGAILQLLGRSAQAEVLWRQAEERIEKMQNSQVAESYRITLKETRQSPKFHFQHVLPPGPRIEEIFAKGNWNYAFDHVFPSKISVDTLRLIVAYADQHGRMDELMLRPQVQPKGVADHPMKRGLEEGIAQIWSEPFNSILWLEHTNYMKQWANILQLLDRPDDAERIWAMTEAGLNQVRVETGADIGPALSILRTTITNFNYLPRDRQIENWVATGNWDAIVKRHSEYSDKSGLIPFIIGAAARQGKLEELKLGSDSGLGKSPQALPEQLPALDPLPIDWLYGYFDSLPKRDLNTIPEEYRHLIPHPKDIVLFPRFYRILNEAAYLMNAPDRIALRFFGPAGTSKTTLAEMLAWKLGNPLVRFPFSKRTDPSDVEGMWTREEIDGELVPVFKEGVATLAMEHGFFLVLDEPDLARPGTLAYINNISAPGEYAWVRKANGQLKKIKVHRDYRVIATENGVQEVSREEHGKDFLRRFVPYYIAPWDREETRQVLAADFENYGGVRRWDPKTTELLAYFHDKLRILAAGIQDPDTKQTMPPLGSGLGQKIEFTPRSALRLAYRLVASGPLTPESLSRAIRAEYILPLADPADRELVWTQAQAIFRPLAEKLGWTQAYKSPGQNPSEAEFQRIRSNIPQLIEDLRKNGATDMREIYEVFMIAGIEYVFPLQGNNSELIEKLRDFYQRSEAPKSYIGPHRIPTPTLDSLSKKYLGGKKIPQDSFIWTDQALRIADEILWNRSLGIDVGLIGEAGEGKTEIPQQIAKLTGLEYYQKTMSRETDEEDLVGGIGRINGKIDFIPDVVTLVAKDGGIGHLDEYFLADTGKLEAVMNPLMDASRALILKNPYRIFRRHDDSFFIVTSNSAFGDYADRHEHSTAALSRLAVMYLAGEFAMQPKDRQKILEEWFKQPVLPTDKKKILAPEDPSLSGGPRRERLDGAARNSFYFMVLHPGEELVEIEVHAELQDKFKLPPKLTLNLLEMQWVGAGKDTQAAIKKYADYLTRRTQVEMAPITGKVLKILYSMAGKHYTDLDSRDIVLNLAELLSQPLGVNLGIGKHEYAHGVIDLPSPVYDAHEPGRLLANAVGDPRMNEYAGSLRQDFAEQIREMNDRVWPESWDEARIQNFQKLLPHEQFAYAIIYHWRHGKLMPWIDNPNVVAALEKALPVLKPAFTLFPESTQDHHVQAASAQFYRILDQVYPIYKDLLTVAEQRVMERLERGEKPEELAQPPLFIIAPAKPSENKANPQPEIPNFVQTLPMWGGKPTVGQESPVGAPFMAPTSEQAPNNGPADSIETTSVPAGAMNGAPTVTPANLKMVAQIINQRAEKLADQFEPRDSAAFQRRKGEIAKAKGTAEGPLEEGKPEDLPPDNSPLTVSDIQKIEAERQHLIQEQLQNDLFRRSVPATAIQAARRLKRILPPDDPTYLEGHYTTGKRMDRKEAHEDEIRLVPSGKVMERKIHPDQSNANLIMLSDTSWSQVKAGAVENSLKASATGI